MTRRTIITYLSVLLVSKSVSATVIYEQDFTSDPGVKATTNFNTNYFGTGVASDLNQNNWIYRTSNGNVTYDAVDKNLDLIVKNNVYSLVDLSSLASSLGGATEFTLTFDVTGFSGLALDFIAYSGGGLDYTGVDVGDGRVFYRMGDTPINYIQAQQGATLHTVFDGTEALKVTGDGTFTSSSFSLSDLNSAGDYLFIGFNSAGTTNLTIDNLRLSAVPEPSTALLLSIGCGVICLRRRM